MGEIANRKRRREDSDGAMSGPGEKPLLSIIIPVYNEEENIRPVYDAVNGVITERLSHRYDWELVFTDNRSTDGSFARLAELARDDPRVGVLRFSRNFGFQRSIWTGYAHARGEAAIQLDCDLQDPPELIPEFVRLWEAGHMVVYGVRRTRAAESFLIQALRKAFYRFIDFLSEDPLPWDAGDFRLIDRKVIDVLKQIDDAHPYLRGTIAALGFEQVGVPYERKARQHGTSKFNWSSLMRLALDGILNHSIVPLRIATFVGLAIALVTVIAAIFFIVARFAYGQEWPAGFTTMTVLILASLGVNALFLGIIGEYLGRMFQQMKNRPITVVDTRINI